MQRRDIFDKRRLTPAQLRTVAQRRFEDAEYLRKSNDNARANGVFYLGGFVIECLLKAKLLERYPSMRSADSSEQMSVQDKRIWKLIYRSHDLLRMLPYLPELQRDLVTKDKRHGKDRLGDLRGICENWTIFARYSPKT